jgi:endonuclease/exonuclease/phosphatase (EEP) superfamily protein YafD
VSANLLAGAAEAEAFAALAARLAADVVVVQELAPGQAEALAERFPYGLLAPRGGDYDGGGIALARPAPVETLPLAERDAYRAVLEPGTWPQLDAPLEILGVHLYAPHAHRGLGLLRRPSQLRNLLAELERPSPPAGRVLIGDFNATPLWPVYRRVAARMEDAARTVARRERRWPRRTWGLNPGGRALLRIDHAFVEGVVPERFQVVPVSGSDHRAVVLDVAVGRSAVGEGRFR